MQDTEKTQFPRRAFLQRATAAVGTTLLGLGSTSALAAVLQDRGAPGKDSKNAPSVGYWDGKKFVAADELPSGDLGLDSVALSISSFGPTGSLTALDANALVQIGKGIQKVPFRAWIAGPSGSHEVRFVMPVDEVQGLVLTAHAGSGKTESSTDLNLIKGFEKGMKLREGVYVIADGPMNWWLYNYDANNAEAPLNGHGGPVTSLQYVVMTVSRT